MELIKFTARILHKFPLVSKCANRDNRVCLLSFISEALMEIRTVIQPSFKIAHRETDEVREVSKAKITELWKTNKKRALQIVKDGGMKAMPPECTRY